MEKQSGRRLFRGFYIAQWQVLCYTVDKVMICRKAGGNMKKLTVYFYSCANLGDDLFVRTLADHFRDCRIRLIANPKCIPQNLGKHVSVHPHSFSNLVFMKLQSMFGEGSKVGVLARRMNDRCFRLAARNSDAYVYIGGSVFMEHVRGVAPLDFSTWEKPDFRVESRIGQGNSFVIGANLGPAYSEPYWQNVREKLKDYSHVCLRDWASYSRVRDLPNVQYAPDVLFLVPQPQVPEKGENVVISLVDMARHTDDEAVIRAYYRLMADTVTAFAGKNIPVTLVSFCEWEGDPAAMNTVVELLPEGVSVTTLHYRTDMDQILEAISGASFVVGSRFHSTILGISFGKPVFPVAYNCKTRHYLQDLRFSGNYADLKNMTSVTVEDVLYNYDNRIVTDCEDHKRYARNQFAALQRFLAPKEFAEAK